MRHPARRPDSSGGGRNGTLTGGCTWVAGKYNNAVSLNGSNGYVVLPNTLTTSLNDFTIAAWVKLTANNTWNRIFDFGAGTATFMFLSPNASGTSVRYSIKYRRGGTADQ